VTTQDVGVGEKKKERKEKKEEEESSLAVSLPSSIIGARRASRNRTGDRRGARRGDGVCPESNFVMPSCCLRAHLARSRVSQAAHNFVACNKVAGCCSCGKQPPRYPCRCYSSLSLSLSIPPTLPLFILSTALLLPAFVSIAIQPLRSALDAMAAPFFDAVGLGRQPSGLFATDRNTSIAILPIYRCLYRYRLYSESGKIAPPPPRSRPQLRALRRAAENYCRTDGGSSFSSRSRNSASISVVRGYSPDYDRPSVGAFRRIGESANRRRRCAILEETVAESGTKLRFSPRNERFHFRSLAGARDSSPST